MQKSMTRLLLVACASVSVAGGLQAMSPKSSTETLKEKVRAAEAAKSEAAKQSQVEQLKENAPVTDESCQKTDVGALLEKNPEYIRYAIYASGVVVTAVIGAEVAIVPAITYILLELAARAKRDAASQDAESATQKIAEKEKIVVAN
jgi:hypothetical protein